MTGTSAGDPVTVLLFGLGGYAEYAVASIWARKPEAVSWLDAAALPSSAEAAAGGRCDLPAADMGGLNWVGHSDLRSAAHAAANTRLVDYHTPLPLARGLGRRVNVLCRRQLNPPGNQDQSRRPGCDDPVLRAICPAPPTGTSTPPAEE